MKSVQIYLTRKNYKILTMYQLESGAYIASEPIFVLPKEIEVNELSLKIADALQASRQLSESEKDKYWLGTKLLKMMKESSFNKLYETSKSCGIYLGGDKVSIEPYKFDGKNQGTSADESRIVELSSSTGALELTKVIIDLLKGV